MLMAFDESGKVFNTSACVRKVPEQQKNISGDVPNIFRYGDISGEAVLRVIEGIEFKKIVEGVHDSCFMNSFLIHKL